MSRKNDVILLCKGMPDHLPPVITVSQSLARLGCNIILVCSDCGPITKHALQSEGVSVECVHKGSKVNGGINVKILNWIAFSRAAWGFIEMYPNALLWVASADTALSLGRRLLKKKYILSVMELYDEYLLYRKGLVVYARQALRVIVPEYCRANILRVWWSLTTTPEVLPNKMLAHPRTRCMDISDESAASEVLKIKGSAFVLYQGYIYSERDLRPITKALNYTDKNYTLVLMGKDMDDSVSKIKDIYPNIVHIPFIPPPQHLQVTSHARFGIATYSDTNLNNVFCAPNKIYEYAGFGIPMLCRDIPGLRYSVGVANAGVCVDIEKYELVVSGLHAMEERYSEFSKNASDFYEAIDPIGLISGVLYSVGYHNI